jgi:hypothetical protein
MFSKTRSAALLTASFATSMLAVPIASADAILYNNLTPNNAMASASRTDAGGQFEIESADDFVLTRSGSITDASFVGLLSPGSPSDISQIVIEIYRVFPLDSDTNRTPNVPTRNNSPSDLAFDSRDSNAGELSFATGVLSGSFTALNSVTPGGIHASPNQATLGNGPITGEEVQFNITFNSPFSLPAGHYFFVPQVSLSSGGQFYWLSASRPIAGAGTTPFPPGFTDLQSWTRDQFLDPDWLRIGTDIVDGASPPTFNAAFEISGIVPEPASIASVGAGLLLAWWYRPGRKS